MWVARGPCISGHLCHFASRKMLTLGVPRGYHSLLKPKPSRWLVKRHSVSQGR